MELLYLYGARFPQPFEICHPGAYISIIGVLREAIQYIAESEEIHFVQRFELLSMEMRIAWILLELLLRSGL